MAAIYSARAIVELILESAEKQEMSVYRNPDPKLSRKNCEDEISLKLPLYFLIEKIRIHDFHRFGCLPPDPQQRQLSISGPMKLLARKGSAAIELSESGPQYIVTGQSQIKVQRPLCQDDDKFLDEDSKEFLGLDTILKAYLDQMPQVIEYFENKLRT